MEVLHTKHPEACPPTAAILDSYPNRPPDIFPVDITNDKVTAVAGRLSGGSGPGGGTEGDTIDTGTALGLGTKHRCLSVVPWVTELKTRSKERPTVKQRGNG